MSTQRNFQTLLTRARHEPSPVTAEDVRSLVETSGPAPSRKFLMPVIVTGTIATLALIAGLLTTNVEEPRSMKNAQTPIVPSTLKVADPEISTQAVRITSVSKPTTMGEADNISDMTVTVVSIESNDLVAMNIDPTAIFQLQRSVAEADSIGQCGGTSKVNSTLCVWHNGRRQELSFSRGDGPMPVMFTSSDGKGQMVRTSSGCSTVDANKLIPVEARTGNGNVVMWFAPTNDIVRLLPDNVAGMIQNSQNIEVHMVFDNDTMTSDVPNYEALIKKLQIDDSQTMMNGIDSIIRNAKALADGRVVIGSQCYANKDDVRDSTIPTAQRPIRNTHARVVIINRNEVGKKIPCVGVDGARLQESRLAAGALRMEGIFPNPTSNGSATVSYSLSEDRQVTFTMYDLAGNKVASTQSGGSQTNGKGQIAFALNNAAPGMYLVTLTTDKGEKAVQRLIVQ